MRRTVTLTPQSWEPIERHADAIQRVCVLALDVAEACGRAFNPKKWSGQ